MVSLCLCNVQGPAQAPGTVVRRSRRQRLLSKATGSFWKVCSARHGPDTTECWLLITRGSLQRCAWPSFCLALCCLQVALLPPGWPARITCGEERLSGTLPAANLCQPLRPPSHVPSAQPRAQGSLHTPSILPALPGKPHHTPLSCPALAGPPLQPGRPYPCSPPGPFPIL